MGSIVYTQLARVWGLIFPLVLFCDCGASVKLLFLHLWEFGAMECWIRPNWVSPPFGAKIAPVVVCVYLIQKRAQSRRAYPYSFTIYRSNPPRGLHIGTLKILFVRKFDIFCRPRIGFPYPTYEIQSPMLDYSAMSHHQIQWLNRYQTYTHISASQPVWVTVGALGSQNVLKLAILFQTRPIEIEVFVESWDPVSRNFVTGGWAGIDRQLRTLAP